MKPLRNIKITLCYFLILLVFSQCVKIPVYQWPDKLVLTDLRLYAGDKIRVTLQRNRTRIFEFSHLEGDNIVGHETGILGYESGKNVVKINSNDIIRVDIITKKLKTGVIITGGLIWLAAVTYLILLGVCLNPDNACG